MICEPYLWICLFSVLLITFFCLFVAVLIVLVCQFSHLMLSFDFRPNNRNHVFVLILLSRQFVSIKFSPLHFFVCYLIWFAQLCCQLEVLKVAGGIDGDVVTSRFHSMGSHSTVLFSCLSASCCLMELLHKSEKTAIVSWILCNAVSSGEAETAKCELRCLWWVGLLSKPHDAIVRTIRRQAYRHRFD